MAIRSRLERLERTAQRLHAQEKEQDRTDEDWLAQFEAWYAEGHFAHEPDFPVALACYRAAMEKAAHGTPPFIPPADFKPVLSQKQRLIEWRRSWRYPDIMAAWLWLVEMVRRLRHGIPPVTEVEFGELAAWFQANDSRLYQLSLPAQLLELSDGRRVTTSVIRADLARGPRVLRAGQLAEDLRQLRALYGQATSITLDNAQRGENHSNSTETPSTE